MFCSTIKWRTMQVIAGELGQQGTGQRRLNARVIPSVAYTDPEVAQVGLTEDQAKAQGVKSISPVPLDGSWSRHCQPRRRNPKSAVRRHPEAGSGDGHAGRGHGKILGGGMVGTHAGDMIGDTSRWLSRWAPTQWTSARPSTPPYAGRETYAWRRKWRMAAARMCRLRASKSAAKLP